MFSLKRRFRSHASRSSRYNSHTSLVVIFSLVALILAACDTPELPATCYIYNFAIDPSSSNGSPINIQAGTAVDGLGIQSTAGGDIIANWSETFFINWDTIAVDIGRPEGVEGDISITFVADAFGVSVSQSGTLPADLDAATIYFEDVGTNEESKNFSATVQASAQIIVGSLTVYVDGVNPYPRNDCAPTTPSPQPPTATLTPTTTLSPTPTFTPSPTPNNCTARQYLANNAAWTSTQGITTTIYGQTARPISNGQYALLTLQGGLVNCTNFSVTFTHTSNHTGTISIIFENSSTGQSYTHNHTTGHYPPCCENWEQIFPLPGGGLGFPVDRVRFTVSGSSTGGWYIQYVNTTECTIPTTATPTLSPTPTQTRTATPTNTRTPLPVGTQPPQTATGIGIATRTDAPTSTGTPTLNPSLTPLPPTVQPPPLTWTPPPSDEPPPTQTLIPLPTELYGSVTPWATYFIPGLTPIPGTPVQQDIVTPIVATGAPPVVNKTSIPVPDDLGDNHPTIRNNLETAVAQVNTLPRDLKVVVPSINNFTQFAGFARYAVSGVNLQEVFGQTLYPIPQHLMYGLVAIMFVSAALFVFRFVMWFLKFANWVLRFILKIIPFIG
jgi:hypothetical protein